MRTLIQQLGIVAMSLALLMSGAQRASAGGLMGDSILAERRSPNQTTVQANLGTASVSPVAQFKLGDLLSFDVTATTIQITNVADRSAPFASAPFSGFSL